MIILFCFNLLFSYPLVLYPAHIIVENSLYADWPKSRKRQWSKNMTRTVLVAFTVVFTMLINTKINKFIEGIGGYKAFNAKLRSGIVCEKFLSNMDRLHHDAAGVQKDGTIVFDAAERGVGGMAATKVVSGHVLHAREKELNGFVSALNRIERRYVRETACGHDNSVDDSVITIRFNTMDGKIYEPVQVEKSGAETIGDVKKKVARQLGGGDESEKIQSFELFVEGREGALKMNSPVSIFFGEGGDAVGSSITLFLLERHPRRFRVGH